MASSSINNPVPNPQLSNQTFTSVSTTDLEAEFEVHFWGVRGGIPTPGRETKRYGGNTACVEMRVGGKRLIFDGGTGLRVLGKNLLQQMPVEAHLFFTHCHWDRIQGFPFFSPAFIPGNRFHIYGATASNGASIKQCLSDQMLLQYFTVPLQVMQSDIQFHYLAPGKTVVTLDDVTVETACLNESRRTIGYRVSWRGHSAVYATDTEHLPDSPNQALLDLARGAELLIYNTSYNTEQECYNPMLSQVCHQYAPWQAAMEVVASTGVQRVVLSHHNPDHDDDFLEQVKDFIQSAFSKGLLAHEGMIIPIA